MSNCGWVRSHLDDYLDGELPENSARELEEHLRGCGACREEHDALSALIGAARGLPRSIEPERELWTSLAPRLRGSALRLLDWRRHANTAVYAALVAAAVIVVVSIGLSRVPPPPESTARMHETVETDPFGGDRNELREAYLARAESLDPELRDVIDSNLTIIENSMVEIRSAMQVSPGNPRLEKMLRTARLSEVELLQQAVYIGLKG